MRALKRRVAELEAQLAAQQAAADAASQEARDAVAGEAGKAAQAAAALQRAEQELAAAREQCREHARRRGELDAQLATAEYERSQWEWRAKVRWEPWIKRMRVAGWSGGWQPVHQTRGIDGCCLAAHIDCVCLLHTTRRTPSGGLRRLRRQLKRQAQRRSAWPAGGRWRRRAAPPTRRRKPKRPRCALW